MKPLSFATCGLLLILLLALYGCSSYSNSFAPIAAGIAQHDMVKALKRLEAKPTPRRNQLLFLMNRGMLLRMNSEFVASNQVFAQAKQLVEELNALSLREQSSALMINDATRSYGGAPYEQVMLNLYSALNYLQLGQLDEARVEALQVDLRLGELGDQELGPLFETDPFARYLTGLIYEAGGEMSDAMISYRKAFQAYRQHAARYPLHVPQQLEYDLLRSSEAVGLTAENQQYASEFGIDSWPSTASKANQGELVFLFGNGLAPVKVEEAATVPVPSGRLVRVAMPVYQRRPRGFSTARLSIGGQVVETEIFENIEELAIAELARNQPAILARALARAILKYQASQQAGKENDLAGLLVNIAGLLTERADTRSWLSLPAEIQLARLSLPAGDYELKVELLDLSQTPVREFSYAVKIAPGKMTLLSCHEVAEVSLLRRH
ncbi:MAG: hypothetical protein L3J63_08770 [Geopsychrobacter sp.]|nr:hypothetical protein [Geopsychrobacter sp.]